MPTLLQHRAKDDGAMPTLSYDMKITTFEDSFISFDGNGPSEPHRQGLAGTV